MGLLSKYLSETAATQSATAASFNIDNTPNTVQRANLSALGLNVHDKVVEEFGMIYASSVFRCPRLNRRVGGSDTSGHLRGECEDLDGDAPNDRYKKVDNVELFNWIRKNIKYDQLIAEFVADGSPRWCHVGYKKVGNRGQVLIATKNSKGGTVYLTYTEKLFNQIYKRARSFSFGLTDEYVLPDVYEQVQDEILGDAFENEVTGNRNLDLLPSTILQPAPITIEVPEVDLGAPEIPVLISENNPTTTNPTVIIAGNVKITIQIEGI